ncbi:hypothetical protein D3C78_1954180 [compost metagenome]
MALGLESLPVPPSLAKLFVPFFASFWYLLRGSSIATLMALAFGGLPKSGWPIIG